MKKRSKNVNGDFLWIVKIIFSVSVLILTVHFCFSYIASAEPPSSGSLTQNSLLKEMNYENDNTPTAVAKTEESTSEEATEEQTSSAQSTQSFETPEDILQFEKEYLAQFTSATPAGTVEEVFFKTSGATDTVKGISIKNATATKKPDFAALIKAGPALEVTDKSEPLVLIFHTHTTESYLLSDNGVFYEDYETRSFEPTKNMVRVGDEICRVLKENGIGYIHDTNIYDESYDGAYSRSRVTVEKYLNDYPSIQIVLDVHRDAIYYSDTSHCKPTAEIDGKKAAQIMIITGAEEGYITDFPNWEDNLRFALCFQKNAEENFPGLMKPLYFCQRKYNMDTAKCSLLLEIGTDANTLEEALYSANMTGKILTEIINESCV